MSSIFRRTYTRPIPPGAEVITRKGVRTARWRDRRGLVKAAPLNEAGNKIVIEFREWYIAYVDAKGKRRTAKGYTDLEATTQKAARLEKSRARAVEGLTHSDPDNAHRPVEKVIIEWQADQERLGLDGMYRYNCGKLMRRLAKECGWTTLAGIRPNEMTRWLSDAAKPCKNKKDETIPGRAARTLNGYLETVRVFLAWCVTQGYLEANPLAAIPKAEVHQKVRKRRALHPDQLRKLLDAAGHRADVYLTAAGTGLRRDELTKLAWGDVRAEGVRPQIHLKAANTKARRADHIDLSPEVAELLLKLRPKGAKTTDRVFGHIPTMDEYKADLTAAGIDYKDDDKRQADFHGLRKTFNMLLALAGVDIRTAMQMMRVTDPRLITEVYADLKLLDTAGAAKKIPRMGAPKAEDAGESKTG